MTPDEMFMSRAIALAKMANARVYPNPFVGAVVVLDNRIIAEGYHQEFGGPHAEVHAVNQIQDKSILNNCTIYVTLEPCAHHGKTPPCADLLVHHKFKRVVIGSVDPFALVNGAGIQRLKNAGIDVEVGVLKQQCDALNERFFTFHRQKRPFITLKWAESIDGFIAPKNQMNGQRTAITGALAHQLVHLQRSREHAILIGTNTAFLDDPELTVRLIEGHSPIRVVLDSNLRLPASLKLFADNKPTIVLNTAKNAHDGKTHFVQLPDLSLMSICDALYNLGVLSVYVEGGAHTLQQFIDSDYWDRIYRFTGQMFMYEGVKAPVLPRFEPRVLISTQQIDQDNLEIHDKEVQ